MAKIDPFNSNPEVSYAITTPPIIVKIIPNISSFLNLSFNKAAPKITEKTISGLKNADGLVVGSAICKKITESINRGQNPVINASNMVKKLKMKLIWTG